jgi:hypothetical protein
LSILREEFHSAERREAKRRIADLQQIVGTDALVRIALVSVKEALLEASLESDADARGGVDLGMPKERLSLDGCLHLWSECLVCRSARVAWISAGRFVAGGRIQIRRMATSVDYAASIAMRFVYLGACSECCFRAFRGISGIEKDLTSDTAT